MVNICAFHASTLRPRQAIQGGKAAARTYQIPTVHVGPIEALEGTESGRSATDAMKEVPSRLSSCLNLDICAYIQVAALWRDSPENPNRGKAPRPKKKKAANPCSPSELPSSSQPRSSDKESAPSSEF
ncbi:hypothetical protein DFS33DRAFT_1325594 [Desarmillaria ectypa]|nr:hypothetical protein DFS33DRAFT_1325594 [Desarmillaria ectypa]